MEKLINVIDVLSIIFTFIFGIMIIVNITEGIKIVKENKIRLLFNQPEIEVYDSTLHKLIIFFIISLVWWIC